MYLFPDSLGPVLGTHPSATYWCIQALTKKQHFNMLSTPLVPFILIQLSSMHAIPTNPLGTIKELPSPSPNSVNGTFGSVGPDRQAIHIDTLLRGLQTLLGSNNPNTIPDPTQIRCSRFHVMFSVSIRTPLVFGLSYVYVSFRLHTFQLHLS